MFIIICSKSDVQSAIVIELFNKFFYELHKVITQAYINRRGCFIGVVNGEIVTAALLKHRDDPDVGVMDYISAGGIKSPPPIYICLSDDFMQLIKEFGVFLFGSYKQIHKRIVVKRLMKQLCHLVQVIS